MNIRKKLLLNTLLVVLMGAIFFIMGYIEGDIQKKSIEKSQLLSKITQKSFQFSILSRDISAHPMEIRPILQFQSAYSNFGKLLNTIPELNKEDSKYLDSMIDSYIRLFELHKKLIKSVETIDESNNKLSSRHIENINDRIVMESQSIVSSAAQLIEKSNFNYLEQSNFLWNIGIGLTLLITLLIFTIALYIYNGIIDSLNTIEKKTKEIIDKDNMLLAQSRQAAMGEMTSMLAHQWRQPLNLISIDASNILASIELDNLKESELKKTVSKISENTKKLSETINTFSNFFKQIENVVDTTNQNIINDTLNIIDQSLKNNNITTKLNITEAKIKTHPKELIQVLLSVIINAQDILIYRNIQDAIISIYSIADSEFTIFEICDNGGGIDDDILNKIFVPYFSTKKDLNGSGLGLYISKKILNNHLNGTITASNRDGSACFTIKIPHEIK